MRYQDFIYRWQEEGYINWFASGVEIFVVGSLAGMTGAVFYCILTGGLRQCHGSRKLQHAYMARSERHAHPQPHAGYDLPGDLDTEHTGFGRLRRATDSQSRQSVPIHTDGKKAV